jgi:DNA-binding transcriptional LysR family regulator
METDRLKYFCAIVDAGGLSRAADILGVSHSGLSKAMSVLQEELGLQLLRPLGRGLEVTDRGKELYQRSKAILASISELRTPAAKNEAVVRIGMSELLTLVAAGGLGAAVGGPVTFLEIEGGDLEAELLERTLDIGFTFAPHPHKAIEHVKLARVAFASFARRGAFAGWNREDIPYVVPSEGIRENPTGLNTRDGWNPKLARHTPFRSSRLAMGLGLVASGLAAIYIPRFLAHELNRSLAPKQQLDELELPASRRKVEESRRDVFLVRRQLDEESPLIRRIARSMRAVLTASS